MAKNLHIRDVDDHTYAVLRERASAADLSLTQYLRRELDRLASMPSMAEWLDRADERRRKYGGASREAVERAFEEARAERR